MMEQQQQQQQEEERNRRGGKKGNEYCADDADTNVKKGMQRDQTAPDISDVLTREEIVAKWNDQYVSMRRCCSREGKVKDVEEEEWKGGEEVRPTTTVKESLWKAVAAGSDVVPKNGGSSSSTMPSVAATTARCGNEVIGELMKVQHFVRVQRDALWSRLVAVAVQLRGALDAAADWRGGEGQQSAVQTQQKLRESLDDIGNDVCMLDAFMRQNVVLGSYLAAKKDGCAGHEGEYCGLVEDVVLGDVRLDALMLGLSDIYYAVSVMEENGANAKLVLEGVCESAWKAPQKFTRVTKKFWILPKDVARFKLEVIKHLPILVYGTRQNITQGVCCYG